MHPPIVLAGYMLLAALMLGAVLADLRSRRIPNRLVLAGIVLALGLHAAAMAAGTPALAGRDWWAAPAGLAAGLAVLMPLYLLRAMGAGDVKLMAMAGTFIGAPAVLAAALYTFLAGGLLALAFMAGRGVAAQAMANVRFTLTQWWQHASTGHGVRLEPLQATAARLPYALAIALGTAAAAIWPLAGSWGVK